MTAHAVRASALIFLLGALPLPGCNCTGPDDPKDAGREGEGEGEGDAGNISDEDAGNEGEGEPADGGPVSPPINPIRAVDSDNPDNATLDSDCDGISDEEEFTIRYADPDGNGSGTIDRTRPDDYDSDDDGIPDGVEAGRTAPIDAECPATWLDADPTTKTSPAAQDSDGDCIKDGVEDANLNGRLDLGELDPASVDSDGDLLPDFVEDNDNDGIAEPNDCNGRWDPGETDPRVRDSDDDGLPDGAEDRNRNGKVDPGETDPRVRDSDEDGLPDGADPQPLVPNPDSDRDGLPDSIDAARNNPDRDGDGLCDGPGTVADVCVAGEDRNANGLLDPNESDPDLPDTDCDHVNDGDEQAAGTSPRAVDTDGDRLSDGVELGRTAAVAGASCPDGPFDADPSNAPTDPTKADTDGDGINDGTEDRDRDGALGPASATDLQETDPTDPDMDDDSLCDGPGTVPGVCRGGEDINRNGRVDANETDPRSANLDSDGDGLSDLREAAVGTDPARADTDGDGLLDGEEVNLTNTNPNSIDSDCDGLTDPEEVSAGTSPVERDTDGDGVTDGVELSSVCVADVTTTAACVDSGACISDDDPSSSTDPLVGDTDGDGVLDGAEDADQNGRFDVATELDPNDDTDVGETDRNACATGSLRAVTLVEREDQTADLALALPPGFPDDRVTTLRDGAGNVVGAMVFSPESQVAGVAVKLAVAGDDATAEVNSLRAVLDGPIGTVTSFNSQAFSSWDSGGANNSVIARLGWKDATAANTVTASMNRIVGALVSGATGLLDVTGSTKTGDYALQVQVLDRSPEATVVVLALANANDAETLDAVRFQTNDLTNGTAVAQFGDDTGVQCDRFAVAEVQQVDFLLVIDNSGSMSNEQAAVARATAELGAQLANSTVSWRAAVVTSDLDNVSRGTRTDIERLADWEAVDLAGGQQRPKYCRFTDDPAELRRCVFNDVNGNGTLETAETGLGTRGSSEENFFRPVACLLGRTVSGDGITTNIPANGSGGAQDGEACGRGPNDAVAPYLPENTYAGGPGSFQMLPRADGDPQRLRTEARLAVIFITDANEQSDGKYSRLGTYVGDTVALQSIPTWASFFQAFEDNADPLLSRALVHGLVCPNRGDCTDEGDGTPDNEPYMNPRFQALIAAMGGIEASLPADADPLRNEKVSAAIQQILQATIAQSSPYVLARTPVSSTLKVSVAAGSTQGPCNTADVPRSRQHGFDYDGSTNAITFFGDCRPKLDGTQVGQPLAVSYRYWVDDTADPNGNVDPCADCTAPYVCASGQCLCPSDCGQAEGLTPGQNCDATTCTVSCLEDCGGCPTGAVCDPTTPDCSCSCPANCNSPEPLQEGQVCDPATCLPACAPGGCEGEPPGPFYTCGANCVWECGEDCGGQPMGPNETCDRSTCTVICLPDCGGACGPFETCGTAPGECGCSCREEVTCGPGFVFDDTPGACGCVCDAEALGCPATHTPDLESCRCACLPDCGGACAPGTFCSEGECACRSQGG